jgi:NAD(P)-dependent dehydrogenase (short-subunit alcohol dehydrogenase family)
LDILVTKAVVFSGTSGIGLATCRQLLASGTEVVAVSRNPNKADASLNGIKSIAVDARDSDAVSVL